MNTTKLIAAFLAIFAISSYADTAAQLKTTIESNNNFGVGNLSVAVSGNTVTVTGENRVPPTGRLALNIDAGVSVIWKASFTGNTESGVGLITLSGSGSFEVQSGKIAQIDGPYGVGNAIHNLSATSTITISGGTVSAEQGIAISNDGGTVTISSGTVSGAAAIVSTGTVNISGGTISGILHAVLNEEGGTATISGGTVLALSPEGYAVVGSSGILTISGGTVSAVGEGIAVVNGGTLTISGGTVSATTGYAIYNHSDGGTLTISGGLVFAYLDIIDGLGIIFNAPLTTSGNGVILGWDNAAGTTTYTAGTNTDLVKSPDAATAVWDVRGGIAYTNGTNTGFFKVDGVTVNAGSPIIPQIATSNIRIQSTSNAILLSNLPQGATVEVYNLQGKLIYFGNSENSQILRIPVQTKGMYIAKVSSASETKMLRVSVR